MPPKSVIFLAFANDKVDNARYLRKLPAELSGIRQALQEAEKQELCEVILLPNATIQEIFDTFQDTRYRDRIAIFHYGGHADGYKLLLETLPTVENQIAHGEGLVSFFAKQKGLQLVFFNGCSTHQQAQELAQAGIPAVIGTDSKIDDEVATRLAIRFYRGIGQLLTLQSAWEEAKDEITTTHGGNPRGLYHKEEKAEMKNELPWGLWVNGQGGGWKLIKVRQETPTFQPIFLTQPPFQSPVFIGREEELKTVHDRLFAGENFLMLVNGQGGIGKTTFAAKYWDRYQNEYSHLAFLFVGDYLSDTSKVSDKYSPIANALLSLSRTLGLEFTRETQEEQLEILVETVSNLQKPCLLILDNANAEKDLNDHIVLLRKCTNFHILLTSRLADFEYAQKYPLGTLDKKHATALFQKHYPLLQETEIPLFEEIYEAVGGNTLVLELLAKNLSNFNNQLKKRYTLAQLKDDLQKGLTKLSQSKEVNTAYQAKGTGLRYEPPEAIILAMYDLSELSEAETALLSNLAVLPAENIKYEILTKLLQDEDIDQTLLVLAQKGWIEQKETAFKISSVVQEIVRYKNSKVILDDIYTLIKNLKLFLKLDKIHLDNYKNSLIYSQYAENILNCVSVINDNIAILYERVGKFYRILGNLEKSRYFFKEYNRIRKVLYQSSPNNIKFKNGLAISYEKIGTIKKMLGNFDESLRDYEQYYLIRKELYENYPNNIDFKNGLAIAYEKLGLLNNTLNDFTKSIYYLQEYNRLRQELYENDTDNIDFKNGLAISYENLGDTYSKMSKNNEAISCYHKYHQIKKELFEMHEDKFEYMYGYGVACKKLGQIYLAMEIKEKSFTFLQLHYQIVIKLLSLYSKNESTRFELFDSYFSFGKYYISLDTSESKRHFSQAKQLLIELIDNNPKNLKFQNHFQELENIFNALD